MDTSSSVGSESGAETKQQALAKIKKPVRGRGKVSVVNDNKGDAKQSSQDSSNVNSEDDIAEAMDTSQDLGNTSSTQESSNITPSPPKKRVVKRTAAEVEKLKARRAAKKNTGKVSSASGMGQDKSKGKAEKKGTQKKGVVNGAGKRGKGAKRTAKPDSDSEQSEERISPKKRKFNLEEDAVPAPKLGKKVVASRK